MKILQIIILLSVLSENVIAQTIQTGWYYSDKKQTFENFLTKQLQVSDDVLYGKGYIFHLKRWNPQTHNKKFLSKGERIYIEVPLGSLYSRKTQRKIASTNSEKRNKKSKRNLIQTGWFFSEKEQTFENFLLHQLGLSEELLYNKNYLSNLIRWNPSVKNIKKLSRGERIYIEIPKETPFSNKKSKSKYKREIASAKGAQDEKTNKNYVENKTSKTLKKDQSYQSFFNIFYTMSKGVLAEEFNSVSLETYQDSPITLGMASRVKVNDTYSISSSLYISRLDGAGTQNDEQLVNLPLETGLNAYLDYNAFSTTLYIGLDYENFSTFNTDELVINEKLDTREHRLGYLTVGASKVFSIGKRKLFTKLGISSSVYSASDRKSLLSSEDYNGSRAILYLNTPINKKWNAHILYKRHFLTGATDLNISRLGAGIGYNF